jgi:hypothetical protein
MVSQNELWKKVSEDANLPESQAIEQKTNEVEKDATPPYC